MKILVIEDNQILNILYETMFKKLEIPYCIAKTAEEALTLYKQMQFDLVLCDFYLPDMDGFNLCEQLRFLEKQKGYKRKPIVLISGEKDEVIKDPRALELFDDWFQKPLTEEKLKTIFYLYLTEYQS